MQCINCGFENIPGMRSCVRCQSSLSLDEVTVAPPRKADRRWHSGLGRVLDRIRTRMSGAWAARPAWMAATHDDFDIPWKVIAWSIIPGLGHLRYRKKSTGWLLLGGWALFMLASCLTWGLPISQWLLAGAVSVHASAILSLLGVFLGDQNRVMQMMVGLVVFAFLRWAIYQPAGSLVENAYAAFPVSNVKQDAVLQDGDVLIHNGPWTRPQAFQRGDLVVYRIPALGGHLAMVAAGYSIDRVVGVPGDHIQVNGVSILVNGSPPANGLGPLQSMNVPSMNLRLGPDSYFIVPSQTNLQVHGNPAMAVLNQLTLVNNSEILGRVVLHLFPLSRFGTIH